jgi:DNA repair ATPase RecN
MARSDFYPSHAGFSYGRLATAAGAIVIILAALFGFYALREMHAMSADLSRANARLTALDEMNRKLDRLADMDTKLDGLKGMTAHLASVDVKLSQTNSELAVTNQQLLRTNAGVSAMRAQIVKLASIRSDIHMMSHKIAGSFLFRAVH